MVIENFFIIDTITNLLMGKAFVLLIKVGVSNCLLSLTYPCIEQT